MIDTDKKILIALHGVYNYCNIASVFVCFYDKFKIINYAESIENVDLFWPNEAMWQHRSGSTLTRVMACCLIAPSHYQGQLWLPLFYIMNLKIILLKLLMHLTGANELKQFHLALIVLSFYINFIIQGQLKVEKSASGSGHKGGIVILLCFAIIW